MNRLLLAVALTTSSLFGCAMQAGDEPTTTDEATDTQEQELQPGTRGAARMDRVQARPEAKQVSRASRGRGDRIEWPSTLCDTAEAAQSELCKFSVPQVAPRRQ